MTYTKNSGIVKKVKRYLQDQVSSDLNEKMVFLGGPRQVGKTTLAQNISPKRAYLNWDDPQDRQRILTHKLPPIDFWVFDEIHKYKQWRNYLKGLYDKNKGRKKILVTGSARLDLFRFSGDSLQGRYHYLRLHPISIDELQSYTKSTIEALFEYGGFPEPFLKSNRVFSKRWSLEYRTRILREDIVSLEYIHDLGSAENLLLRLPSLVSNPLSINALREDLQVDFSTVKRWIAIYERFYAIFRISPFGAHSIKAVKKEQKHYHFDWTLVLDPGPRFENMIACHLLKWVNWYYDTQGRELDLRFYKDQERREIDFVISEKSKPLVFIECKHSKTIIEPSLNYIKKKFPDAHVFQLTYKEAHHHQNQHGVESGPAHLLLKKIKSILDEA